MILPGNYDRWKQTEPDDTGLCEICGESVCDCGSETIDVEERPNGSE